MKKELKIDENTALKLYKTASNELKEILEQTFTKNFFNQKLSDKINNFEDILKLSNKTEKDIIPWLNPINKNQKSQNAVAKIQLITELFNGNNKIDFYNKNQIKYYLYWEKTALGWVLLCSGSCGYVARMGSGFYFINKEDALFCASKFKDIFIDYLPE